MNEKMNEKIAFAASFIEVKPSDIPGIQMYLKFLLGEALDKHDTEVTLGTIDVCKLIQILGWY